MLTSKESLGAQDFYESGQCDLSKVIPKQLMTKLRTDTALQSPSSQLNRNPWKPHFSVLRVFQLKSGLYDAGIFSEIAGTFQSEKNHDLNDIYGGFLKIIDNLN